jgi:hypothetical protein
MSNVINFPEAPPKTDMDFAKGIATDDLKLIWDDLFEGEVDGFTYSSKGDTYYIDAEMVHQLLNERGEGEYCAV